MIDLILLCLLAPGQGSGVQKVVDPPSGGVSPLAWVIICALATAVVALGKFCLTLYGDLKKSREDLAQAYEDQASLLKALRSGLEMPKPMTHVPPPNQPPSGGTQGDQA